MSSDAATIYRYTRSCSKNGALESRTEWSNISSPPITMSLYADSDHIKSTTYFYQDAIAHKTYEDNEVQQEFRFWEEGTQEWTIDHEKVRCSNGEYVFICQWNGEDWDCTYCTADMCPCPPMPALFILCQTILGRLILSRNPKSWEGDSNCLDD